MLECGRGRLDFVLHHSKDDVGLVFDGSESHRGYHHDHEIESLELVRLSAVVDATNACGVHTQLADVDNAFAGARMRKGTISAGYSQVIPSQPIAKKVLKTNRKSAATMPVPLPVYLFCMMFSWCAPSPSVQSYVQTMIARIAIENAIPAAPNSMLDSSQQAIMKDQVWVLTADAGRISL